MTGLASQRGELPEIGATNKPGGTHHAAPRRRPLLGRHTLDRHPIVRRLLAMVGIQRHTDLINLHWRLTRGAFGPAYTVDDIIRKLAELGLPQGSVVMVHSSWRDFRHFTGTPQDVIRALEQYLGPTGTLAMPAFPPRQDPSRVFDVRKTPTGAGLIPEVFRRQPGVRRSISLNHSVCARGPAADYLTRDHHLDDTSFDERSPYYRLAELDGWTVTLGLGRTFGMGSVVHCAESLLQYEIPKLATIWAPPVTYRYRDWNGLMGEHTFRPRGDYPWSFRRVERHLNPKPVVRGHVSSLQIQVIRARSFRDQVIALARRGITCYH